MVSHKEIYLDQKTCITSHCNTVFHGAFATPIIMLVSEEGRRPSEGQKNPENSPKAKTSLAKAKQVFLFFQMMKNVVH